MKIEKQIERIYDFQDLTYEDLHMPTNDVLALTNSGARFALKLYNPQSRSRSEVEWELDLLVHLMEHDVPIAKPVKGRDGFIEMLTIDGQERAAALFEWAKGEKPSPSLPTYHLLGQTAAQIHSAADSFKLVPTPDRIYDTAKLVDEQLARMKSHLEAAKRWQQAHDLGERLKSRIEDLTLDWGICHMDLTLDNIHLLGDDLTVFDFDSAGQSWRALEPYGVLRSSNENFQAWLEGYRQVRDFSSEDEKAVSIFAIVGDLRVTAWKLGVANSSRGEPLLDVSGLTKVVDGWLEWENRHVY